MAVWQAKITMLPGRVVADLALSGASVLAAVAAVVTAGVNAARHPRRLVSRPGYRVVRLPLIHEALVHEAPVHEAQFRGHSS